jgi:hypothetical protein
MGVQLRPIETSAIRQPVFRSSVKTRRALDGASEEILLCVCVGLVEGEQNQSRRSVRLYFDGHNDLLTFSSDLYSRLSGSNPCVLNETLVLFLAAISGLLALPEPSPA